MEPCDIAWAAGLFEGEGCICISSRKDRNTKLASLQMNLTDFDVLERFSNIATGGLIHDVASRADHHKQQWKWSTNKRSVVKEVLLMLLPYFGNRRAYKALNVLDHLELSN
jgi:hypothetical protein